MTYLALILLALLGLCIGIDLDLGLTADFKTWLDKNGYADQNYMRADLVGGSYGGKANATQQLKKRPIVFIHGLCDVAVGVNDWQVGYTTTITYFLSQGYTKAEMYAATWGDANCDTVWDYKPNNASHDESRVMYLRKFIDAVLNYTQADMITVIAHSMGVTLTRRALKGGLVKSADVPYYFGPPLTGKVDVFVSLAGGNQGIVTCARQSFSKNCNPLNGFWPASPYEDGPSFYMKELNADPTREAQHVFALYSTYDDTMVTRDIAFGLRTSIFPTVDDSHKFWRVEYSHHCIKDLAGPLILHMIQCHNMDFDYDSLLTDGIKCDFYPHDEENKDGSINFLN